MLSYLLLPLAAFLAALLTLFSGFGLGTLLMPVVAIFFPVAVAVALTAAVHLVNNLFKLTLLLPHVDGRVTLAFGLPALLAALPGAWLLTRLAEAAPLARYPLLGLEAQITPAKLLIGLLLVLFALVEWRGSAERSRIPPRFLPLGGLLSGFFGGLSGHQGALRSAFLLHSGLDAQAFIATNAAIASLVDLARLAVYGVNLPLLLGSVEPALLAAVTLAALAGVLAGRLGLHKVTLRAIQRLVALLLLGLGAALAAGLI